MDGPAKYSQGGQMQHGHDHPVTPNHGNVGYNARKLESAAGEQYAQLIRQGYNRQQAVHMVMAGLGFLHDRDRSGPVKYKGGLSAVPSADRPPSSSTPPATSHEPPAPAVPEEHEDVDFPDFAMDEDEAAFFDDDEPVLKESSVRSGFNRRGTTRRHPVDNRRRSY
jgi:hypothetical protein